MSSAAYPPPSAPPADMFGTVPGYEGTVAGGGGYLPPPMPLEPVAPPQPGPAVDWSIPALTEDVVREAFSSFVSSHCCYGDKPVKEGVITGMEPINTFRYRLETFTEYRSTEWATKPYEGEPADFYTQTAPRPWEVQVPPPSLFTNHEEEIRVPYTSSIQDCKTCHAQGTMQCDECHGNGYRACHACNGSGKRAEENCDRCDATGNARCTDCKGQGTQPCENCDGKRQVLSYIKLKVEWKNNVEEHMVEQSSGLKVSDFQSVSGKELFKDSQYLVYPLLGFPNPDIAQASERLTREHQSKYAQTSRILQQRHIVELIPITKVNYKWKSGSYVYYVYGNEHQVSADDYPETCCCVIL